MSLDMLVLKFVTYAMTVPRWCKKKMSVMVRGDIISAAAQAVPTRKRAANSLP